MTDITQDGVSAADNVNSALGAAEQELLIISQRYDPSFPKTGCFVGEKTERQHISEHRRILSCLNRFDGDIFDYTAAFRHDENLETAVIAAVRIADTTSSDKRRRSNIRQMRSLLKAQVSPAVLAAFYRHLYMKVFRNKKVERPTLASSPASSACW